MLPVGSRFTEINLPNWIVNHLAILVHALTVGLHIELLDVSRELQQSLSIW